MTVELTKKYVKDALVVWSSYLNVFTPLKWEFSKQILKEPFNYQNLPKDTEKIYLNTMFMRDKDSLVKINISKWQSSLVIYTDKLCQRFLIPNLKAEDFTEWTPTYNHYYLEVKLCTKPNELDILQSLIELTELKHKNIKLPLIIRKN